MIMNTCNHRGNGNNGAGKADGPSDDVMDLLHIVDVKMTWLGKNTTYNTIFT